MSVLPDGLHGPSGFRRVTPGQLRTKWLSAMRAPEWIQSKIDRGASPLGCCDDPAGNGQATERHPHPRRRPSLLRHRVLRERDRHPEPRRACETWCESECVLQHRALQPVAGQSSDWSASSPRTCRLSVPTRTPSVSASRLLPNCSSMRDTEHAWPANGTCPARRRFRMSHGRSVVASTTSLASCLVRTATSILAVSGETKSAVRPLVRATLAHAGQPPV